MPEMKKVALSLFLLIILLFFGKNSFAASHYVRSTATGTNDGTDWTNAFISLPANLVRGDTYYVADGNYGSYTFNDPESGSEYITVKKAILSDHGTETGWSSTYGDGVAVFPSITFDSSYIVFDGQVGGGPGSWDVAHGFELYGATPAIRIGFLNGASHITISHVDAHVFQDGWVINTSDWFGHLIYANTACDDVTVSYSYLHDVYGCQFLIRQWTNFTLEYSYIYHNDLIPGGDHGEPISTHGGSYHTYRYNKWKDISGTGMVVNLYLPTNHWYIYGNIIVSPDIVPHGLFTTNTGDLSPMTYAYAYNNLVVNAPAGSKTSALLNPLSSGSRNNFGFNNMFYNIDDDVVEWGIGVTHDYNYYYDIRAVDGGYQPHDQIGRDPDIFVDYTRENFRLKKPTNSGMKLNSPFNEDPDGTLRGDDGIWERGAFEHVAGDNPAPKPPVSLHPGS